MKNIHNPWWDQKITSKRKKTGFLSWLRKILCNKKTTYQGGRCQEIKKQKPLTVINTETEPFKCIDSKKPFSFVWGNAKEPQIKPDIKSFNPEETQSD